MPSPPSAPAPAVSADLHRALQFYRAGDLASAERLCRSVLAHAPSDSEALHLLGVIAFSGGYPAIARDLISQAIAFSPHNADFHLNLGNALVELKDRDAALASFNRAAQLRPDLAEVYFYRANLLQDMKRFDRAIADYDRAIVLNPHLAESHFNRGNALASLNRRSEALQSYLRSSELLPGHLAPKKNVFWHSLALGAETPVIENLTREMSEIEGAAELQQLAATKSIAAFRAAHDLEQAAFLREQNYDLNGLEDGYVALASLNARSLTPSAAAGDIALSPGEIEGIARFRKIYLRHPVAPFSGPCLDPGKDWAGLEERYLAGEILIIDNFLSASALAQLQQFCLTSTVWRREYNNGYLGAFAHAGFVSPLHLQIARDMRLAMPRVFAGHELEQLWAFKYDSRAKRGINVHADFARVNLNFWITPDSANLDPDSGGMIIYDKPPPGDWNFQDYNDDERHERIYAFLADAGAAQCRVPYRCNRAVLFDSNLFHETDVVEFKTGYEDRRINVTYLFGRGGPQHPS